jgi:hypothetical protein
MKRYYVYEHIRLDTDTVFYVGYSTIRDKGFIYSRAYRDPYKTRSKNGIWEQYASNLAYKVRIVQEFCSKTEALTMETTLIKLYGRLDLGTGSLINQNDGGQGMLNSSEDLKKVISQNRKSASNAITNKRAQLPYSHSAHKYNKEGVYIESYTSISEAARANNTLSSDISMAIKGKRYLIAGFQWRRYKCLSGIGKVPQKKKVTKSILQIDYFTKEIIKEWISASEASRILNISRTGINNCLKETGRVKTSGGFIWKYQ